MSTSSTAACRANRTGAESKPPSVKNRADQREPIVRPFNAWRTSSEDVFDIAPLRLQRYRRKPDRRENVGKRVGNPGRLSRPPHTITRAPSRISRATSAPSARKASCT